MRSATRKKTGKDPEYRAFIKSLPCVVCFFSDWRRMMNGVPAGVLDWNAKEAGGLDGQASRTEVCHVGDRGLSQKSPDRETIPLCCEHHREGRFSAHKMGRRFYDYHEIDKARLITALNETYERRNTQ